MILFNNSAIKSNFTAVCWSI